MIYVFYTSLALAAILSIGTIKAQMAHIKGLKEIYKQESLKAHDMLLETLRQKAELKNLNDVRQTWANRAHELNDQLRSMAFQHLAEVEDFKTKIYEAEQYRARVREQKRLSAQKIRRAKRNA